MSDNTIEFAMEPAEPAWKRIAHVTVAPERMDAVREAVVMDLRKRVKRPGFRKGKVPTRLIRSEFAAEVERESLERLVPQAYREILQAHEELHPMGEPTLENLDLKEGQPVHFDLALEVRPDIELQDLSSCQVERVELEIGEDRVDGAMKDIAERSAKWVPVERAARTGDALLIEYVPLDEEGTPLEKERTKEYAMELGGEGVLPEFNDALQGLEIGEDTQVEVRYPEDYPRTDLAGRTMSFEVRLHEIKEKQVPALDDDLAQSISSHQSLAELRQAVRQDLEQAAQRQSEQEFREALVDEVLKVTAVAVPPTLEARYVQAMVEDLERRSNRKFDEETRRKLAESYGPAARRATQRWLLVDHIKRAQDVEVPEEALQGRIEEIARERDTTADEVRQALELRNGLDRVRMDLEEDRVFDWLKEQVEVKVVTKRAEMDERNPGEAREEDSGKGAADEAATGKQAAD